MTSKDWIRNAIDLNRTELACSKIGFLNHFTITSSKTEANNSLLSDKEPPIFQKPFDNYENPNLK